MLILTSTIHWVVLVMTRLLLVCVWQLGLGRYWRATSDRVASDLLCAFEDFPLIFLESSRRAFWYNQMEDFIQCCIKHRMFHTPPYCNWIEIICNLLLTWILFPTYHLFSHPLSLSLSLSLFFLFSFLKMIHINLMD